MSQVSVDSSLIKEALAELELKEQALAKLAALEVKLDIINDVIDLTEQGYIDPADMQTKIAEFTEAPDSLLIFKKAVEFGSGGGNLGSLTSNGSEEISKTAAYGDSAEARFHSTLSEIIKE